MITKRLTKVADVLYAHAWDEDTLSQCRCGWEPAPLEERGGGEFGDHVDHQAAELDKAGVLK